MDEADSTQQSPPRSAGQHSMADTSQTGLTPSSRCTFEIPNDNENDGQYVSEFWLNALVPKPHTNFFGYESSIGPICISISTRESHECYKALVRTPFKFGVVYVPTMVIDEPVFGTDLDRLSSPTPQKVLLYHALRLYFQQADDERRGYLLTALRNQRLSEENTARVVNTAMAHSADAMWGRAVLDAVSGESSEVAHRKKRGLQRSNTKRSIELRRAEITEFMDGLFQASTSAESPPERRSLALRSASFDADPTESSDRAAAIEDAALQAEIQGFLAGERSLRDLAVATESLTEIRDDHLKPLLRNLEPRLYRRRLRIDFVVVGSGSHSQLADMSAPHRRFLRALERASARMRGDPGSSADSPRPGDESSPEKPKNAGGSMKAGQKPAKRKKTREELEAKRNNVVQELIATERSYVEKLRALIDIYVVPLRSAARSANNALIPAYDAHVIFGNIERVSEVNERFLGDLEAWNLGEMDPKETIGSLCRDHFVDFHVYKRYINGYQHALSSSRELEGKNPLYAAFLQKAREREECRKLGISDLLIMPVQRIPRYTLLLTDLLKVTPDDDPDVARIQLALERVNEIGQLADNQVAESVAELHHIHTTIQGCPPNLISASREFIGAIDVAETDLATNAPKKPMCLMVFSDRLMIVERFWPPKGHGGIRVTGKSSSGRPCSIHGSSTDSSKGAGGPPPILGAATTSAAIPPLASSASMPTPVSTALSSQSRQSSCTCDGATGSGSPAANAFLSATSGGSSSRKYWGRFAGWVDITRVSVLDKSLSPSSRSFFIHRYPTNSEDTQQPPPEGGATGRQRTATSTSTAAPVGVRSSGSSIISLDSTKSSPIPSLDAQARLRSMTAHMSSDQMRQEFARILYPIESTYESYGDHGYWYPQSLHEFEADHPLSRDAFFEFLNTAWERTIARCFESTSGGLSRHGSGSGNTSSGSRLKGGFGHRKSKSGVDSTPKPSPITIGHPELDRVDVGGQSWTVRIWDSADYMRTRQDCPSALSSDMTVIWDYQQVGSPGRLPPTVEAHPESEDMGFYPFQACRVVDFGDDYFHVTSTVLPLDTHHSQAALDSYAELIEEREIADSWSTLCRLVEQAIIMYQYVLLAYPEHRRVQQCYNRSILASLFGQNALGSSSSVKTETVSAAPRKLFSRARHLFSSGKHRGSHVPKDATDTANLFSSAYSNAVAVDTIGPSSGSSPYNHSTISTPLTVLGRYKLKTKSSTMVSTRRVHTLQHKQDQQQTGSPGKSASTQSTPSRKLSAREQQRERGGSDSQQQAQQPLKLNLADTVEPPSNKRKGSDLSMLETPGVFHFGRKPAHTIDELPMFSNSFDSEPPDARGRSRTSCGSRNRSNSVASPNASPTRHRLHVSTTLPKDGLPAMPRSASGLSSSLADLGEDTIGRGTKIPYTEDEMFVKRRSMSVVSISSLSSVQTGFGLNASRDTAATISQTRSNVLASNASISAKSSGSAVRSHGLYQAQNDNDSEFSLQLDLNPQSNGLDIPSDLKLEFDEALSGAGTTPPESTHGPTISALPLSAPYSGSTSATPAQDDGSKSVGLNLHIPPSTRFLNAKHTWETKSPDDRVTTQLPLSSADSIVSYNSTRSTGSNKGSTSRSLSRRRGVYGAPLHSPMSTAVTSPPLLGEPQTQRTQNRPAILLDIARELGEDEPFSQPQPTSPFYVDDDEMAQHLDQMSIMQNTQISPLLSQFGTVSSMGSGVDGNSDGQADSQRPLPMPPSSRALNSHQLQVPTSPQKSSSGTNSYLAAWPRSGKMSMPQPPVSTYNLQQHSQIQDSPQSSASSPADYRRLPSLPPRVRSTAAASFMDSGRNSVHSSPGAPRRQRPAHPPF
ncbi:hypothetical protein GGF46_004254 [Coemansia sp. RSA 552]|nr:hypothetical protein GGF46_004254 [Coemansia sp. RSA 552]